jgi:hypothetical protein
MKKRMRSRPSGARLVLLVLVAREDDDAARAALAQQRIDETPAERSRAAGDEDGLVVELPHRGADVLAQRLNAAAFARG